MKKIMPDILRNSDKNYQHIATNHKKEKQKQNIKNNEKCEKNNSILNTIIAIKLV